MKPFRPCLGMAAEHQHLVITKKRTSVAFILESGEPERGAPFCNTVGLWRLCHQPVSGPGDHPASGSRCRLLDKDYYAAVDDYNAAYFTWHCQDCFQDGYFTIQSYQGSKILRPSVSTAAWLTSTLPNTISRDGRHHSGGHPKGGGLPAFRSFRSPGTGTDSYPGQHWETTKAAAAGRSICTIPRPSICCRWQSRTGRLQAV